MTFEEGDPDENPWVSGKPKQETISVEPFTSEWSVQFAEERAKISQVLGENAHTIEHVGSTAVEGLPAKPVMDIDLIVKDPGQEESYVPALSLLGYELTVREPSWYSHRMLRREKPRVNLHVFGLDSPEHTRHILFRDWLRNHPEDRQYYAQAKLVSALDVKTVSEYNAKKQDAVRRIYRKIFTSRGWNPDDVAANVEGK